MLYVTPASREEALWLASRLRREDVQEIEAASGRPPMEVLPLSLQLSKACFVIRPAHDADPIAIFGVSDDPSFTGLGIVWMLCTAEVPRYARSVLDVARLYVAEFLRWYPKGLHNIVDARNSMHVRWCRHLGFRETTVFRHRGRTFIHIYMKAQDECVTL